jgi:hypothetical protein
MTYPQLLGHIYRRYADLLKAWNTACDEQGNAGVLVFLPEDYSSTESFNQVRHKYWTAPELLTYLKAGVQSGNGYRNLLFDLDFGEEFLVMIVEFLGDESRRAVHVHKITRVGLN